MIHSFIQFVEQIILPLGVIGVFLAEVIEEIIVPIPSALVLLTSGFIFLEGPLSGQLLLDLVLKIAIPASLGLTLGSLVVYYFAFYGGKIVIDKYSGFLGITWQEVLSFEDRMNKSKYDEAVFIFIRVVPIVPSSLVAIFSGVTRMPIKKYLTLTLLGSFIKAMVLGFVGYKVGNLYRQYAEQIGRVENTSLKVVLGLFVCFILYRVYKWKVAKSYPQNTI